MSSTVLLAKITSKADSTAPIVLLTSKASMGFSPPVRKARLRRPAATIGFRFHLATVPGPVLGARPRGELSPAHGQEGPSMQRTLVVIPARMQATRLPGKPLIDIGGEPLIVHVWRCAMAASVGRVVV